MSGEVRLTSTLSKDNVPVTGQPQLIYTLLEIVPSEVMANVQMPLNVSLVLDTSGSMSGEKIKRLKDAVKVVIDLLGPDDLHLGGEVREFSQCAGGQPEGIQRERQADAQTQSRRPGCQWGNGHCTGYARRTGRNQEATYR